jgi:putrescine importer
MGQSSAPLEIKSVAAAPRLRRVLTLWDLIFYGIVLIQPIAPVPLFGWAQALSHGYIVDTILLAMVAMMITAFSYGRMAALYPAAGSAYTYVGRGLNPHLGFLAGWAMFLDYLIIPLICTIYSAVTIPRLIPGVPYVVGAALFIGVVTFLNLLGIRSTARTNEILLFVMSVVIVVFVIQAVRFLFDTQGWGGLFSTQPFYNPQTFNFKGMATATSFAALTYIGFDGVTTLAEDVVNPKRNVLLATVLVCVFTGVFSGLQIYLAQRVWPDWHTFPNLETAFMDVARLVSGPLLFQALGVILIVGSFGSALTGQVGAARLLFGMGRDRVLPPKVFAYLDPKRNTPTWNIWIIAILAFGGAVVLNYYGNAYEHAAELLNFGAFLAFMGVNLACLRQYYFTGTPGRKRKLVGDFLVPGLGFVFCLGIWINLPRLAQIVGSIWFLAGFTYDAVNTRGFRTKPVMIDFSET